MMKARDVAGGLLKSITCKKVEHTEHNIMRDKEESCVFNDNSELNRK